MKIKSLIILTITFIGFIAVSNVWASGGESDAVEEAFDTSVYERKKPVVDQAYESGKAVYTGRKKGVPKLSYCLKDGDQMVELKRKSIKQYKGNSYSGLAAGLYNCETSTAIKPELARADFIHVLYYLDKRYKLKLQRS